MAAAASVKQFLSFPIYGIAYLIINNSAPVSPPPPPSLLLRCWIASVHLVLFIDTKNTVCILKKQIFGLIS